MKKLIPVFLALFVTACNQNNTVINTPNLATNTSFTSTRNGITYNCSPEFVKYNVGYDFNNDDSNLTVFYTDHNVPGEIFIFRNIADTQQRYLGYLVITDTTNKLLSFKAETYYNGDTAYFTALNLPRK